MAVSFVPHIQYFLNIFLLSLLAGLDAAGEPFAFGTPLGFAGTSCFIGGKGLFIFTLSVACFLCDNILFLHFYL